ncbi:DUF1499 domain-containing protein [Asticcacaulis sp. BYS171W]|uniref:DUF1499 domain-containing protein n=1 Tax=Asticcacaulis aquaticus TaxID=2984212 RepID=A0ABT5HW89_9CAUL|nr:DUF1499 domain-containing protein [Asticcacaulis aquaticus]MDC7684361.1 DUF1499 domain-containing protein [Asticcacaulis aquaticus]
MSEEITHHETPVAPKKRKKGFAFAHLALIVSLIAPLTLLAAMLSTSVGYLSYDLGFNQIALDYVPKIATTAMIICTLSLLISLFMAPRTYGPWALMSVIVSGGLLAGYYAYETRLKAYPPIHDVSTNWERPVTFSSKLVAARGAQANPIEDDPFTANTVSYEWRGQSVAAINAQTCPDAIPILGKPKNADQVADILKDEGYVVFGRSEWRVEATYEDPYWGLKSDVVVRIEPDKTDIRSVSREELADLGGNCRRVLTLLKRIKGA